ncbi:helix-turn-helix domain-containing protein [Streptomyces xiamenensis]
MTPAEFIVETQWTLLLLIILLPLIIGMIANREFRAAILNRRLSVSTSGIEMEPTAATTLALATATATDEEVAAEAGASDADVTVYRREAIEELMRTAAHWGWHQLQMGCRGPPDPIFNWDADGGPTIRYASASTSLRMAMVERVPRDWELAIGQRIREKREEAGLTHDELAERTGFPPRLLANLENGRKIASRRLLEPVAHTLGVPYDELRTGKKAEKSS